jgi:hypothetical protein
MTDLGPAPSVSRMRFSFHLPLQKEYVVPARCSSCDSELDAGAVTYPLRLESEGKTERFGTIIPMPLCGHCHRRRTWERAGAFIGMLFGGLAVLALFPALRAIHPLLGVISAIIFFFGVAIGFSIIWMRVCDLLVGLPRYASVLFYRQRGSDEVFFSFANRSYGERFMRANQPASERDISAQS